MKLKQLRSVPLWACLTLLLITLGIAVPSHFVNAGPVGLRTSIGGTTTTPFWDPYPWLVLGGMGLLIAESIFIAWLLVSRAQQQRAQAALRTSAQTLASILDAVPQAIFWKDRAGVFLGCNQAFGRTLGISNPAAIIGKTDFDLVSSAAASAYRAHDQQVLAQNQPKLHILESNLRADGSQIWSDTTKVPLTNAQGKVYGVLGIFDDISEDKQAEDALQQSEASFRALIEQAPIGIVITNETGKILYLNPAYQRMFGLQSADERLGHTVHEYVAAPYRVAAADRTMRRAQGLSVPNEIDVAVLHQNGSEVPVHIAVNRVHLPTGPSNITFITDTTERKRAEEALQQSEARFRTLIEQAPMAIVIIQNNIVVFCNAACERVFGLEYATQAIGRPITEYLAPEYRQAARERAQRREQGMPAPTEVETVALRQDGSQMPVYVATSMVHLSGGLSNVSFVIDISKRKETEAAERQQRLLAKVLADSITALAEMLEVDEIMARILAGVSQLVPDGGANIMLIEQGVAHVTRSVGYHHTAIPAEFLSLQLSVSTTPNVRTLLEERKPVIVSDTHTFPGWVPTRHTEWIRSHVGLPICVKGQVIGILNLDSATPNFFSSIQIEPLQAFANNAGIALERARLYASLQEVNQNLQAALDAKDEMIQNVSHELRTPLTHISGYAEVLLSGIMGDLSRDRRESLEVISSQARALQSMVNRLIDLQNLSSDYLGFMELDINTILAEATQKWHPHTIDADIDFSVTLLNEPVNVYGSPDYLRQAMDQLIENALKFSSPGGKLCIQASSTPQFVRLAVSDTGIGIPTESLQRVFERFYQVDGSSTRRYGGMGIGLALVHRIVEVHHGRIWVESPGYLGLGTTFVLELPMQSQA